jgi:hypothetical protein
MMKTDKVELARQSAATDDRETDRHTERGNS